MKVKSVYKKYIFLFLFFCIPFFVKANWDILLSVDTKNVFVDYYDYYDGDFETQYKADILIKLAQKLVEKSDNPNLQVYINLDYFGKRDVSYHLGYDNFICRRRMNLWEDENCEGLVIFVTDKDIYIEKILTILSNALQKVEYIKSNQIEVHKENKHSVSNNIKFDTLYSISSEKITHYSSNPNNLLNTIISEKVEVERRFTKKEQKDVNYYYQKNKYHFYTSKNTQNLLVVDNVLEIEGNTKDGYFIFDTDSTFYYLTMPNKKIKGRFKIDDLYQGRHPIYNYQHKTEPTNLFLFNLSNSPTQILFVPDSNFVYSNYQEIDKKIIDILIRTKKEKEAKEKLKNSFTFNFKIAFYISLVIILGLLILIWQTKRK